MSVSPDGAAQRYERLFRAFERCRALAPDERERWLAELGAEDELLACEVRRLLGRSGASSSDALSDAAIEERDALVPWMAAGSARAANADESEPLPERIGPYRILRRLGAGGMGVVYEAQQETPRRRVALKLVRPGLAFGERLKRFRMEAEALGRLKHPGIAQIFEFGTCDLGRGEQPYLAMELVEGEPLLVHAAEAKLDRAARLALVSELCDAVQHAHERGVVHRDLKPDNVHIDGDGRAKVLDFGVARVRADDVPLTTVHTAQGEIVGTLTHMAPEQLGGNSEAVGPAADVYALGVIAFELLTGRLPHEVAGLSLTQAVRHITEVDAPKLGMLDRSLRGDLETIVAKALDADPARRYVSPAAFASDLRRFLENRPIAARRPSLLYRAAKFTRRHRGLVAGVTLALFAIGAGIAGVLEFARREAGARADAERFGLDALAVLYLSVDSALEQGNTWLARDQLDRVPDDRRGWEWRWLDARAPLMLDGLEGRYMVLDGRLVAAATPGDFQLPWEERARTRSLFVVDLLDPERLRRRVEGLEAVGGFTGGARLAVNTEVSTAPGGSLLSAIGIVDLHGARLEELIRYEPPTDGKESRDLVFCAGFRERTLVAAHTSDTLLCDWVELSTRAERASGAPRRFAVSYAGAENVVLSPDGEHAVLNHHREVTEPALLLALEGWQELGRIGLGSENGRVNVAFDRSGKRLVSSSKPGQLEMLAVPSLSVLQTFQVPMRNHHVHWVRDDEWIVVSAGSKIQVLDPSSGTLLEEHDIGSGTGALMVSPDGRFAGASGGITERPWILELGAPPPTRYAELAGHSEWVYSVAFSPGGDLIASAAPCDPLLRLWDGWTGEPLATLSRALARPNTWANYQAPLVFTADGRELVTTTPVEGGIAVVSYDLATGEARLGAARANADWPVAPREAIQDLAAAVGGLSGRILGPRLIGHPDGERVFTASAFAGLTNPCPVRARRLDGGDDGVDRGVALGIGLSPDGRLLALGEYGRVRVIEAASGHLIASVFDDAATVMYYAVAWSPDGSRLAVGDSEGRIRILETGHFRPLLELPRHGDYVYSLAWSPDGKRLISASGDKTLRLHDTLHSIPRRLQAEERARLVVEQTARLETLVRGLGDERAAIEALLTEASSDADRRRSARRSCLLRWARAEGRAAGDQGR